jgi:hypothetical protein
MTTNVLGLAEIESFIELGYCTLPGAFTAEQAAAACRRVWQRMEEKAGIREDDPATWPACYDIEEHLTSPEVLACFTDRLAAAVTQLLGQGRWCGVRKWGLWPVNFAVGAGEPYDFPSWGWHIDGNWFLHSIDCPKQGLLLIGLFTDIVPRGGGTILALGSHKRTARVLAQHSRPVAHLDLFSEVLSEPLGNFYEITGAAGDIVLAHPFLFHNRGMKHQGPPRIISNTEAGLRQPMMLERANGDYSILELSIRRALCEPAIPLRGAKKCWF